MISKTIILNLIALQLFLWCCDKNPDLIVHQAALKQRLKPVVKWRAGEWGWKLSPHGWFSGCRKVEGGGPPEEGGKVENRTKRKSQQAAELFNSTQILPILLFSFLFFLSFQMLNWGDYNLLFVLFCFQLKSEN